jgi:hypothetical protein
MHVGHLCVGASHAVYSAFSNFVFEQVMVAQYTTDMSRRRAGKFETTCERIRFETRLIFPPRNYYYEIDRADICLIAIGNKALCSEIETREDTASHR